jgi:hypothetical protein
MPLLPPSIGCFPSPPHGNRGFVTMLSGAPVPAHDVVPRRYIATRKRFLNPIPAVDAIRVWGTEIATGEKIWMESIR